VWEHMSREQGSARERELKISLQIYRTLCPSRSLLPRLPAPRLPCANNKMFKRSNPRWFARRPFRVKFRCVDIDFFFSRWTYRLKREEEGEKCRREMSLEGAFANGSVAHTPFRNVCGCYLDTIPARFDGCVASICPKTLVLRASFTGNHTNRERASREKTIAKKQGREEISDLSCPGNLSLSLMLSD